MPRPAVVNADDLQEVGVSVADLERLAVRARHRVGISLLGVALWMHFESAAAAERFSERYGDFPRALGLGVQCFAVSDPGRGLLLWAQPGSAYCWPGAGLSPDAIAFLADAIAWTSFFRAFPEEIVVLHGAAVGIKGAAAAIVGPTTAGKTTTAIACGRNGMRLLSDERVVLRGCEVTPFPRRLNVRLAAKRLLQWDSAHVGGLAAWQFGHLEGRSDMIVGIAQLFPGSLTGAPARLRALFILGGKENTPRVTPLHWTAALPAALSRAQAPGDTPAFVLRVARAVRGAACYELTLGRPDETARLIRQLTLDHLSETEIA